MLPKTREIFPELIGNDSLKQLASDLASGTSAHAYIIEGAAGSGKRTAARLIAQTVLCENRNDPSHPLPCGVCPTCRRIAGRHCVDVLTLAPDNRGIISVDMVRRLRQTLYLAPNDGDKKIYVIEDAHRMNTQAQNALLLSLEEPPQYVMLLLLAEDSSLLLETIRSRAPIVKTERFSAQFVARYLSERPNLTAVERERIPAVSHLCGGSLGAAVELLSGGDSEYALYKTAEELLDLLINGKRTDALVFVQTSLPKERERLCELLTLVSFALRDLLAAKRDGELLFFTELPDYARRVSVKRLVSLSDAVIRAERDIAANGAQTTVMTALVCGE